MNNKQKELLELDLYALFEIEEDASLDQIKKAYRKKALEHHPDKNLGNKEEAEKKFVELGKIFEVLTDAAARSAYDTVRRNKREREKRTRQLDEKRRKLKEDLEARERSAAAAATASASLAKSRDTAKSDEEIFQREIERLRKAGSKLLEEEMNKMNEEIRATNKKSTTTTKDAKPATVPRIKVAWTDKTFKNQMNKELLVHLFSKYGDVSDALLSEKKSNAIVEFKYEIDALKAYHDEINLNKKYSIVITWLGRPISDIESSVKKQDVKENATATVTVDAHLKESHEYSHLSFDDMEAAILKKLKKS